MRFQLLFFAILLCYFVSCDKDEASEGITSDPLIGQWQGELSQVYRLTPIDAAGDPIQATTVNTFNATDFLLTISPGLNYGNGNEIQGALTQVGFDSLLFEPLPDTCPPEVSCFFHANDRQAFTQIGDSLQLNVDWEYIDSNNPNWDVLVEYEARANLSR